ncbi:hypothetical protein THRCLA_22547, partial [Thraustotheca clavata]
IHFAPLLHGQWEFIYSWDDGTNFIQNSMIQKLSLANVKLMCTAIKINVYEPLGWLLKAILYTIFGLNSQSVRVSSCILHWVACGVWYNALNQFFYQLHFDAKVFPIKDLRRGSFYAVLLYAVHPLHVEVIAWPSAQPYALAMFFVSVMFWVHLQRNSVWLSTVVYICAIMSKSIALFTPLGLVLLDLTIFVAKSEKKFSLKKVVLEYIAYGVVFVHMAYITIIANHGGIDALSDTIYLTMPERIIKFFHVLLWHLGACFLPIGLRPHYRVDQEILVFTIPLVSCKAYSVVDRLFVVGCIWRTLMPKHRASFGICVALFPWVFYLALLLPVAGIVQHGMVALTADRYSYFALLSLLPVAAIVLTRVSLYSSKMTFSVIMVAFVLANLSSKQMYQWRAEEDLWKYSLRQDPEDWRILDQLAEFYLWRGRNEEALPLMNQTLGNGPTKGFKAQLFQAKQRILLKRVDEGCSIYTQLLDQYPQNSYLHNNIAVCHMYKGNAAAAINSWIDALRFENDNKKASIPQKNLDRAYDYLTHSIAFNAQLVW